MQLRHTLKHDLTKALMIWGTVFFILLAIVFLLSFKQLEGYMLGIMADHRLSYQTREFAKHLDQQDSRSIQEEGNALAQDTFISAILMIDASGELLHISLNKNNVATLKLTQPISSASLQKIVDSKDHLHLYSRPIPGHTAILALILDDRPVQIAIFSATAWTALLMLTLLLVSIKVLHVTLRRSLIQPVDQLRKTMRDDGINQQDIDTLDHELPDEAADILEIFDHLKHAHADMRSHITDMMTAMPSCFWWSENGKTYTGISDRSAEILATAHDQLIDQAMWDWTGSVELSAINNRQLQQGIAAKRERLDFAYQIGTGAEARWFGESITLCFNNNGQLDVIYGLINDISKRKISQQQQAETLEVKHRLQATSTLVGGIAHEFNNALAGMNGNLYLIKQAVHDDPTLMRVNRIEQLIERSAVIIDRMLAFSRQSMTRSSPVDLIEFLTSLHTAVLPTLPDNVEFRLQLDGINRDDSSLHPMILADVQKMQELLLQLIDNARLATEHTTAPQIELSLEYMEADDSFLRRHDCLASRDLVHLTIHDNGCGIPADIRKRIFEPFFTTREVGQGTGLGLSMAHGYIHQIGGDIVFDSEIEHGTTFHIYLPRIISQSEETRSDTMLHGNGETILVIDDDQMVRESTCAILERLDYHPVPASSGEQGVKIFSQQQAEIRLVFMDIVMPGINGIEASRRIRKITPDIPIIFLTGYDRSQPLEADVYADQTDLINKPYKIDTLSRAIQQAIH
ncbi:MAG: response regulator [Mariprofundus sp.]